MLSSNMAASTATEIKSFMKASFYIIVHNGFSMNFSIRGSSARWSRVRMTALDIQVSLRNPTAMLETAWRLWKRSIQRCYIENQKGAITIDIVQQQRPSGSQQNIFEHWKCPSGSQLTKCSES